MIFTNMNQAPTAADFADAIDAAKAKGAVAIRTSALFPTGQGAALDAGFQPVETLALLKMPVDAATSFNRASEGDSERASRVSLRPIWTWQLPTAASIDRLAFGEEWGNTTSSLHQILSATLRSRARLARLDRKRAGFAICGATGDTGYVQRLAVHPDSRRHGVARRLVVDGIDWMKRIGVGKVFVNTGVDNHAALALYAELGFENTNEVLTVNEFRTSGEGS